MCCGTLSSDLLPCMKQLCHRKKRRSLCKDQIFFFFLIIFRSSGIKYFCLGRCLSKIQCFPSFIDSDCQYIQFSNSKTDWKATKIQTGIGKQPFTGYYNSISSLAFGTFICFKNILYLQNTSTPLSMHIWTYINPCYFPSPANKGCLSSHLFCYLVFSKRFQKFVNVFCFIASLSFFPLLVKRHFWSPTANLNKPRNCLERFGTISRPIS